MTIDCLGRRFLWIARTGSPWRDLPAEFGKWYSVYTRFWCWSQKGVWERVFKALSDDPDFEYVKMNGNDMRTGSVCLNNLVDRIRRFEPFDCRASD
jgi:transposase